MAVVAPASARTFSQVFAKREGPYHLYDAGGRPLIRMESGAHVLGALLDDRARLVFLDDAGSPEESALRITYPTREWCPGRVEPSACDCGEGGCAGRLVITLHDAHAGPGWMLTFRG
jgi:hypothetical protein